VSVWHGTDADLRGRLEEEKRRHREGFDLLYAPELIAIEEDVRGPLSGKNVPIHYLNLRNKLWIAWMHYPLLAAIRFGVKSLLAEGLRALRYGRLGTWWRGAVDGIFAPSEIRSQRSPLLKETWNRFRELNRGVLVEKAVENRDMKKGSG